MVRSAHLLGAHLDPSAHAVQVPNEKLMATDIVNITESKAMQDRIQFEVDATDVTPDLVRDLSDSVAEVVALEHLAHLYDAEFTPYAAMVQVTDPLKYQVRLASSFVCMRSSMCPLAV